MDHLFSNHFEQLVVRGYIYIYVEISEKFVGSFYTIDYPISSIL